ncbi:hypothetical protein V8C37DRAFT_394210 [Trichoderma ceciliae]
MASKLPPNWNPEKSKGGSSANKQPKGYSTGYVKSSKDYSMHKFLSTPQRHETWDWEGNAARRNDRGTKL